MIFQGFFLGLTLLSATFTPGGTLPARAVYHGGGCLGGNRSPQLHWSGVPRGTKSFVVTVHDPDAPAPGGWWHWVRFGIAPGVRFLPAGSRPVPPFGFNGTSSFDEAAYGGPCPPPGDEPHHYVFVLRALDIAVLHASFHTTGPELEKLIAGHVLASATLVGRYGRPK